MGAANSSERVRADGPQSTTISTQSTQPTPQIRRVNTTAGPTTPISRPSIVTTRPTITTTTIESSPIRDKGAGQKRRASSSPDRSSSNSGLLAPPPVSLAKRRFVQRSKAPQQALAEAASTLANPLDILALAAASRPHVPSPEWLSVEHSYPKRRVILLNSPFPSPLVQQNRFDLLVSLLSHVDILLNIASYLSPQTLLDLYSISAPFHYVFDSHFTSFIMACTRTWAPKADKTYPWWCFRQLCIQDPAMRRVKPNFNRGNPNSGIDDKSRQAAQAALKKLPQLQSKAQKVAAGHTKHAESVKAIPSFRWLKMVAYREAVCREIIGWMAAHGHRVPRNGSVDAIKKMWFLMDMPVNGPRISLIHNTSYFGPHDLFLLQMFFIKLDMLYLNPIHVFGGEWTMRQYLLQERGLTTLWNYLRGVDGTSRLDVVRLWIKHGYRRPMPAQPMTKQALEQWEHSRTLPIMGVPAALVGRFGYECWGLGKTRLLRPDELVMREGVRRRLDLQRWYLRMIGGGYMDGELRPLSTPKPDEAVLSLIRRRKNREIEARNKQASVQEKDGSGDDDVDIGEESESDESDGGIVRELDKVERLLAASLNANDDGQLP